MHMHSAAAAQHKGVLFNILPTKRFSMILSSPGIAATPETDTVAPFVQRIEHESYMSAGVSVPLPAAAVADQSSRGPENGTNPEQICVSRPLSPRLRYFNASRQVSEK